MKEKERANFLAINAWVFFTFNYFDPKEIIEYICKKEGRPNLANHLYDKFSEIYDMYGSRAAFGMFYCELGTGLKRALTEYVIKEYAPKGLFLTDEDKNALGI